MASDAELVPETIGNYELLTKIAEGGMGAVHRARHQTTGQIVAIKIVPPNTARNTTLIKRFEREFNAAHEIDHPNVVRAIEFCGTGPTPFLVMEYVDGESLGQRLDREGRLNEEEAKKIIVQVCQGLHRAHKHLLIHRDVKPDNVLLTASGVAKLTDLGLVKGLLNEDELNLTRTGRGLGTPHFMAPEQFRDAKNADKRCDVYSIGATMYMMVTGTMPFDGTAPLDCWMKKIRNDFVPPKELVPEISDRTNFAILRAMDSEPDKRPATCREFVEDLLGQSTRQPSKANPSASEVSDLWYLVYHDEEGTRQLVKGTTDSIRRALKDHLLGDAGNVTASRAKQGPFENLDKYPEFRDLILEVPVKGRLPVRNTPIPQRNINTPITGDRRTATPTPTSTARPELRDGPSHEARETRPTMNSKTYGSAQGSSLPHIPVTPRRSNNVLEMILWTLLAAVTGGAAMALYLRFVR